MMQVLFRRRASQIDPRELETPADDELTPEHVTPSIVALIGVWTSPDRPNQAPAGPEVDGQMAGLDDPNPERQPPIPVLADEALDDPIEQASGDTAATVETVAADRSETVAPIDNLWWEQPSEIANRDGAVSTPAEVGVTDNQSSDWRKLAAIPESGYADVLEQATASTVPATGNAHAGPHWQRYGALSVDAGTGPTNAAGAPSEREATPHKHLDELGDDRAEHREDGSLAV